MVRHVTRDEWADALESGKFEQGRGGLARVDKNTGVVCHCVLGVLAELCEFEKPEGLARTYYHKGTHMAGYVPYRFLPVDIMPIILAKLNDSYDSDGNEDYTYTFPVLAKYIRALPEKKQEL